MRDQIKRSAEVLLKAVFAVYILVLLRLTVFRDGFWAHPLCAGRVNLTHFSAYAQLLSWGSYRRAAYLFFGNIAWFIPLGAYMAHRRHLFGSTLLAGVALSAGIEGAQFVLGSGLFETDDLLLNSLGAAVGWGLTALIRRIGRKADRGQAQKKV